MQRLTSLCYRRPTPMFLVPLVTAVAPVLTGCAEPRNTPDDLHGLARYFFRSFEPPERDPLVVDTDLQDGLANLHEVLEADTLEERRGTLDDITAEELASVGMEHRDPEIPQGLFIANVIHCPLDELEQILLEPDQLSLYPEAYSAYSREYDDDRPENIPTWTLTYTSPESPLFANQFTVTVRSGLRKVEATDNAEHGRALLRRGFMPEPAVFREPGDEVEFAQDYQAELYYERAPGEVVHFYSIWRYLKLGILGDSTEDLLIDQILAGMLDWDSKTDALCAQ
ncbi:MAG: hypothetical protein ACO3JL_17175 [Myxococcota bacterium]